MDDTLAGTAASTAHADTTALSGLAFSKGHGTGNDFVLIADPHGALEVTAEQVAALCDRHRGIGGDGLIRAVPSRFLPEGTELLAQHPEAEWFMDYRNGDGSLSEMCGNGVRVFVHFLVQQGLVDLPAGESLVIGTRAGIKTVVRTASGYAVDMGPWEFIFPGEATARAMDSLVSAHGLDVARPALSVSMGNPHTVVALAENAELAAAELRDAPVLDPVPAQGSNVEYIVMEPARSDVAGGEGALRMRVFERGVGETRSCGTGACAAAIAAHHWAGPNSPLQWRVDVPGGQLRIGIDPNQNGTAGRVTLAGPAVLVAGGTIG